MTGAQPIHRTTGERGPVFPFASLAALWIVARVDSRAWRWEPVDLEAIRRARETLARTRLIQIQAGRSADGCPLYSILPIQRADLQAFAAVESPAVSPTLDR